MEILGLAAGRAAARHARVGSVGDGVWDVQAARQLGWPFLGIGSGARAEKLRAAGATLVLPDLTDTASPAAALDTATVGSGWISRCIPMSPSRPILPNR